MTLPHHRLSVRAMSKFSLARLVKAAAAAATTTTPKATKTNTDYYASLTRDFRAQLDHHTPLISSLVRAGAGGATAGPLDHTPLDRTLAALPVPPPVRRRIADLVAAAVAASGGDVNAVFLPFPSSSSPVQGHQRNEWMLPPPVWSPGAYPLSAIASDVGALPPPPPPALDWLQLLALVPSPLLTPADFATAIHLASSLSPSAKARSRPQRKRSSNHHHLDPTPDAASKALAIYESYVSRLCDPATGDWPADRVDAADPAARALSVLLLQQQQKQQQQHKSPTTELDMDDARMVALDFYRGVVAGPLPVWLHESSSTELPAKQSASARIFTSAIAALGRSGDVNAAAAVERDLMRTVFANDSAPEAPFVLPRRHRLPAWDAGVLLSHHASAALDAPTLVRVLAATRSGRTIAAPLPTWERVLCTVAADPSISHVADVVADLARGLRERAMGPISTATADTVARALMAGHGHVAGTLTWIAATGVWAPIVDPGIWAAVFAAVPAHVLDSEDSAAAEWWVHRVSSSSSADIASLAAPSPSSSARGILGSIPALPSISAAARRAAAAATASAASSSVRANDGNLDPGQQVVNLYAHYLAHHAPHRAPAARVLAAAADALIAVLPEPASARAVAATVGTTLSGAEAVRLCDVVRERSRGRGGGRGHSRDPSWDDQHHHPVLTRLRTKTSFGDGIPSWLAMEIGERFTLH
ncbi:hypothetical protein BC828DRAFT_409827 [Blastocladiella britannica]|nr:hypothetical protein BC828DRAFT_409827 [Blastocladiella britannica]